VPMEEEEEERKSYFGSLEGQMIAFLYFAFEMNVIHSLSQVPKKDAVPIHFCDRYMTHKETRRKQTIMWMHLT